MLRPWFPQGIIWHFSESVETVVVQDEQQQRDQWYQWKCGWTWRWKYLGWLDAKQVKKNSSKYQFDFSIFFKKNLLRKLFLFLKFFSVQFDEDEKPAAKSDGKESDDDGEVEEDLKDEKPKENENHSDISDDEIEDGEKTDEKSSPTKK